MTQSVAFSYASFSTFMCVTMHLRTFQFQNISREWYPKTALREGRLLHILHQLPARPAAVHLPGCYDIYKLRYSINILDWLQACLCVSNWTILRLNYNVSWQKPSNVHLALRFAHIFAYVQRGLVLPAVFQWKLWNQSLHKPAMRCDN